MSKYELKRARHAPGFTRLKRARIPCACHTIAFVVSSSDFQLDAPWCGPPLAAILCTAMKTKSHGTAFAHPVAPLMWKSGTCHVLMARVVYVARPAAASRSGDAFTAKKSTLTTLNQISGSVITNKPDMSKQRQMRSLLTLKMAVG